MKQIVTVSASGNDPGIVIDMLKSTLYYTETQSVLGAVVSGLKGIRANRRG